MYLGQAVKPVLLDCTFHQQERAWENVILTLSNIKSDIALVKKAIDLERVGIG